MIDIYFQDDEWMYKVKRDDYDKYYHKRESDLHKV